MASQTMFNSMKWPLYPTDSFEHFTFEVPWWARVVLLFDFTIFLPIIIVVCVVSLPTFSSPRAGLGEEILS